MTTPNATRQGLLPGVVNDTRKSVTMPQTRKERALTGQKGIPIGRDWKVNADDYNVTLYRRTKSKTGKERWSVQGYYTTLGNALVGLVRQGIRDTELASIQAVQDKIAQLEHDILRMAAGR